MKNTPLFYLLFVMILSAPSAWGEQSAQVEVSFNGHNINETDLVKLDYFDPSGAPASGFCANSEFPELFDNTCQFSARRESSITIEGAIAPGYVLENGFVQFFGPDNRLLGTELTGGFKNKFSFSIGANVERVRLSIFVLQSFTYVWVSRTNPEMTTRISVPGSCANPVGQYFFLDVTGPDQNQLVKVPTSCVVHFEPLGGSIFMLMGITSSSWYNTAVRTVVPTGTPFTVWQSK